jgi:hypothetical protein
MGQFLNQIRKKLGLEPKRDKTLTGKVPNEVIINRGLQNEDFDGEPEKPFVLAPARMATPQIGHSVMINAAQEAAKKYKAPYNVVLTRTYKPSTKRTVGAKVKDALQPEQKLMWARKFNPGANINLSPTDQPNLLSQAAGLHRQGINHLVVVAGSDRVPEYQKLLNTYNGKQGNHGYFNFKKISIVPAGEERDEKAAGAAGWSGSRVRKAVESGDLEGIRKNAVPGHISDSEFNQYIDHLRTGMGLNQQPMNEARASRYVVAHTDSNGKQVGWKSSDGYHVKYWQMHAKKSADKHAGITEASEGYPVPAIPTRSARDAIGKKSPMNNLPAPDDKGNIGLDANLKGNEKANFNLMRRRTKKRQLSVGFLEGYDEFDVGATDSPKPYAAAPNAPVASVPATKIKPKKIKEGMFAADIANGDTGEGGNPNQSMEGIPVTAKETRVKKFKQVREGLRNPKDNPCWSGYKPVGTKKKKGKTVPNCVPANEEVEDLQERGADGKGYYRSTESGAGLTRKGAKHFGIKTAVTTPPSKLKPGGKAAKRRKSFCARMGGMPGPMKDEKGRPTRKAMSLRRWNCEETDYEQDEGSTIKTGKFERGDKVKIKKDGYKGKGRVDMYDPVSDTYLVSLGKHDGNLHLKASEIKEHIVKVKGGYELKSKKTGKNLGKYPTKAGAEKRERQVQYFKHMGEGSLSDRVKSIMEGKE